MWPVGWLWWSGEIPMLAVCSLAFLLAVVASCGSTSVASRWELARVAPRWARTWFDSERAPEIGLDGLIPKARPHVLAGRARRFCGRARCPRRPGSPSHQVHAHRAAGTAWRLGQIRSSTFKGVFGIGGPSRPRRCPRPSLWRGAGLDANHGPARQRADSRPTMRAADGGALLGPLSMRFVRAIKHHQAQRSKRWRRRRRSSIKNRSVGKKARRSRQAR